MYPSQKNNNELIQKISELEKEIIVLKEKISKANESLNEEKLCSKCNKLIKTKKRRIKEKGLQIVN